MKNACLASALSLMLCGCSSAALRMKLAPELAPVESQIVRGRDTAAHTLQFGRWQVTPSPPFVVDSRSVGLPSPTEVRVVSMNQDRAGYEFDLSSEGAPARALWGADCHVEGKSASKISEHRDVTDETEVVLPGFPRLDCRFSGVGQGQLVVRREWLTQRDTGSAEFRGRNWQLRSVNVLENQRGSFPLSVFGYELMQESRVVAAVETLGPGRVWMQPGLTAAEQDELAVVMTSLLNYVSLLELQGD